MHCCWLLHKRWLAPGRSQTPRRTSLQDMIWPFAFFTRRSFLRKYLCRGQGRDKPSVVSQGPVLRASQRDCCCVPHLPELALGTHGVRGPDLHAVHGGADLCLCGVVAADNHILVPLEDALQRQRARLQALVQMAQRSRKGLAHLGPLHTSCGIFGGRLGKGRGWNAAPETEPLSWHEGHQSCFTLRVCRFGLVCQCSSLPAYSAGQE